MPERTRPSEGRGCILLRCSRLDFAALLERRAADPAGVLAHRLAAATIRIQIQSGLLPTTVRNLANSALPAAPPAFG